jgi:hypothetical protein
MSSFLIRRAQFMFRQSPSSAKKIQRRAILSSSGVIAAHLRNRLDALFRFFARAKRRSEIAKRHYCQGPPGEVQVSGEFSVTELILLVRSFAKVRNGYMPGRLDREQ